MSGHDGKQQLESDRRNGSANWLKSISATAFVIVERKLTPSTSKTTSRIMYCKCVRSSSEMSLTNGADTLDELQLR